MSMHPRHNAGSSRAWSRDRIALHLHPLRRFGFVCEIEFKIKIRLGETKRKGSEDIFEGGHQRATYI